MYNKMWGIIYTITCNETGEVYVGQTVSKYRVIKHLYDINQDGKRQCTAKPILDRGDWSYKKVDEIEFEHQYELNVLEGYYQKTIPNCINKHQNGQLVNQPYKNKKEYMKIYSKAYREGEKRAEILEKKRQDHQINGKERGKKYREAHKDEIKEKKKKEYEKDKANGKCDIIQCECGGTYSHKSKARHFQTKKHQEYLKTL